MDDNQRMNTRQTSPRRRSTSPHIAPNSHPATRAATTQRASKTRSSQRKSKRRNRNSSASARFEPITQDHIDRYDRPKYDIHFIDNLILKNKKNLVKIKTSKNRVYKKEDSKIVEKNIEELTKIKNRKIKQLRFWNRIRYNLNRLPKNYQSNVLRQSNTSPGFRLLTLSEAKPTLAPVRMG